MRRRFLWFCCKHRSLKDTSGHFLKKVTNTATSTSVPLSTFVTMEASADFSMDSGHAAGVYNCPQCGCIRVFQRVSISERDLSLENRVLINFTKMCYIRVRVALLLKAAGESGESGFLTECALGPGAQARAVAGDPIVFKETLSTQESKWIPANCWRNLTNCGEVTSVPSRGVEILLAASCYRNRDKLWTL